MGSNPQHHQQHHEVQYTTENVLFFDPPQLRLIGSQQAISDLQYLFSKQCFGLGVGHSSLEAVLFSLNQSGQKQQNQLIFPDQMMHYYRSVAFSEIARRHGFVVSDVRLGNANTLDLPVCHIPYLLDAFLETSNKLPYRLGVVERTQTTEIETSVAIADVKVKYYTARFKAEAEYHTIWIVHHGCQIGLDEPYSWSTLVSPDTSTTVASLLQIKNSQSAILHTNVNSMLPSTQQQSLLTNNNIPPQKNLHLNGPTLRLQTTPSTAKKHPAHPAERVRIPGAPPFETSLPLDFLTDCTMEELLTYYPEHVLHWPGLAILCNHHCLRLSAPAFANGDTAVLIRDSRVGGVDIRMCVFRDCIVNAGRELLRRYDFSFDRHMRSLCEAVQVEGGHSLDDFLDSVLWTPPKNTVLRPPVPLAVVGRNIIDHHPGKFSARIYSAMQGRQIPLPHLTTTPTHPMIMHCTHGAPSVYTDRENISELYYPLYLPSDIVIENYWHNLRFEVLLYVLLYHDATSIARLAPVSEFADPNGLIHDGDWKRVSATLRKRQQVALQHRARARGKVGRGVEKEEEHRAYKEVLREFREEVSRVGVRGGKAFGAKGGKGGKARRVSNGMGRNPQRGRKQENEVSMPKKMSTGLLGTDEAALLLYASPSSFSTVLAASTQHWPSSNLTTDSQTSAFERTNLSSFQSRPSAQSAPVSEGMPPGSGWMPQVDNSVVLQNQADFGEYAFDYAIPSPPDFLNGVSNEFEDSLFRHSESYLSLYDSDAAMQVHNSGAGGPQFGTDNDFVSIEDLPYTYCSPSDTLLGNGATASLSNESLQASITDIAPSSSLSGGELIFPTPSDSMFIVASFEEGAEFDIDLDEEFSLDDFIDTTQMQESEDATNPTPADETDREGLGLSEQAGIGTGIDSVDVVVEGRQSSTASDDSLNGLF